MTGISELFHRHKWGQWYFEDEVDHTIRHCFKCGKRESADRMTDLTFRVAEGKAKNVPSSPIHWYTDGYLGPQSKEKIIKMQDFINTRQR